MDIKTKEDKLREYSERHNRWTDKAINQLGYSLNLFTTIGIASVGYLVTNREKYPKLDLDGKFDSSLALYFVSLLMIYTFALFGSISILSRLYSFRITRHLAYIRKKHLEIKNNTSGISNNKVVNLKKTNYYKVFKDNVLGKIDFINNEDLKSNNISERFDILRLNASTLGSITWKMHKYQIILLLIASLIFSLTIF